MSGLIIISMHRQQQMEIEASLNNHTHHKSDIVFYEAFSQLRRSASCSIFLLALFLAVFIALIPINMIIYEVEYDDLIISFIMNAVAAAIGLILYVGIRRAIFGSVMSFLILAQQSKHAVDKQPINDVSEIQSCVSNTIYIAEDQIKPQDLNDEGKKLHLNIAKNTINAILRNRYVWVKNYENLYVLVSFSSMVYAIIVLAGQQMATIDTVILSIYVFIVGISNLPLIIICILLCLSPLICIGIIIFCCCCATNRGAGQFIDLQPKEATATDAVNAGGQCSICYMNIGIGQRIYVLPCSEKHVFHSQCLRHWAKVKSTCPICRGEIPMTDVNRYSRSQNRQQVAVGQAPN